MITLREANQRGHANHGWLDSYHTFSFANYYDASHMAFRSLRVINEDRVQPGYGFGAHSHQDMEIITYVLEGALEHKDNIGNGSVMKPGDVQRMSAGVGITHSEYNHSKSELVHFLQIWILPEVRGIQPGYEQKMFSAEEKQGKLRAIVAKDGREGALKIHQDMTLYATLLAADEQVTHQLVADRHAWIQVARGTVQLNNTTLKAGDGAAISKEGAIVLTGKEDAEVLLFDLA